MNCSEFIELLDMYIDGELDTNARAQFLDHAAMCADCREKLTAAEQLQGFLSHMDEDISVPLPAQAAWRNAIRAEAKRMRMKRVYAALGAVAAACVVTLGAVAMLQTKPVISDPAAGITPMTIAMVESDGISEEAALEAATAAPAAMMKQRSTMPVQTERVIFAEDVAVAYGYLQDIVAEYGGSMGDSTEIDGGYRVYLQIPGENGADFAAAVDHIGSTSDDSALDMDIAAEWLNICVVIRKAE